MRRYVVTIRLSPEIIPKLKGEAAHCGVTVLDLLYRWGYLDHYYMPHECVFDPPL